MERGVLVGGMLICASFLVAVVLNGSARDEEAAGAAIEGRPERECGRPAPAVDERQAKQDVIHAERPDCDRKSRSPTP